MTRRQCLGRTPTGQPCHSPPLHDSDYCLMHSPEHKQEAQDARRLGGLRRKREVTVAGAYDYQGLETVTNIRRLLDIVAIDTLGMENGIARNRLLIYLALASLSLLKVGEMEDRLAALEQAIRPENVRHAPAVFDVETNLLESGDKEQEDGSK